MGKTFIYSLSCPYTKKVKYIGKTTGSLESRLSGHNVTTDSRVSKWARKLFMRGRKPIIEIIDIVSWSESNYWERYWIHQFIAWGFDLLNHIHTDFSSSTEGHLIPELRIKNPSLEEYMYVVNLAENNKRSIPKQFELIIE
jgi:hypothetical protein